MGGGVALTWARRQGWLPEFEDKVLYIALALAVVLFCSCYTTFFTNPKGLGTGTFGGIAYWLAQQEVKRAGQPWYYYLIIAPLYEFLPIGLGLVAMALLFDHGACGSPCGNAEAQEAGEEAKPRCPLWPMPSTGRCRPG